MESALRPSGILRTGVVSLLILFASCAAHGQAWEPGPFVKQDDANPVLTPLATPFFCPIRQQTVRFEAKDVFNPAAVVREGKVYLLYRAQDSIGHPHGTSRIGLAVSEDGVHFARGGSPVLYPNTDAFQKFEWEGGCEDPRVVEDARGTYYMTYTAYDGRTARLFIATSGDLVHWKKHGSVFGRFAHGFPDKWTKSGAIVCRASGSRLVAARIGGKFWMYWGESDIFLASSENLLDWTPLRTGDVTGNERDTADGDRLLPVLRPRKGNFDNALVEPGPPALLTGRGIVLLYNSKTVHGDPDLPEGAYAAGAVLFDSVRPWQTLDRSANEILRPDRPYELRGQVPNVCFVEALVRFRDRWYLYYGAGDSVVAVAECAWSSP